MNLAKSVYQVCQQNKLVILPRHFSDVKFLYFLLNWVILNPKPKVFLARLRVDK
jgi:hypothetical protein